MSGSRYSYQISTRVLLLGSGALSGLLLLLFLAAGPAPGWLWWLMTAVVAGLLGLSCVVGLATWKLGPIEVVADDECVTFPVGLLGTRRLRLSYGDIKAVRAIGRASASRRTSGQEALYVTYGERYAVLMSELFADQATYLACRDLLFARVRAANPEARLDVDGKALDE